MISPRVFLILTIFTAAFACVNCDNRGSAPARSGFAGNVVEPVRAAPAISAANVDGAPFQLQDLKGKAVLLVFGFTYCPDVCPMTLGKLTGCFDLLGDEADSAALVFVSVDPERDTPEKLASYVSAFRRGSYGLHLEGDSLAQTLRDYGIKVTKNTPSGAGEYYTVDHTGNIFLIDPEGRLRVSHPQDTSAEALAADVKRLLADKGE